MTASDVVGVDIGGTKIAAAVVTEDGSVLRRASCRTPPHAVLETVVGLVQQLTGDLGRLGVAAPGVIDLASGSVLSATDVLPGWAGTPVRRELEARLGVPVRVDNDVRAMARGEASAGAGRDHPDALYVSVGTGVGGAVYRAGTVLRGPHALAGEIAHLLVPGTGDQHGVCGCGRRDHLEASVSGPAIERAYRQHTGHRLGLREIAALLRDGDAIAMRVITTAARLLGRALAGLLASIDGTAVIIAGGVAQVGRPFLDPLTDALHDEALPPLRDVAVLPARLGTDAPLVGAALLAREVVTT